jgi:hypothetical protein
MRAERKSRRSYGHAKYFHCLAGAGAGQNLLQALAVSIIERPLEEHRRSINSVLQVLNSAEDASISKGRPRSAALPLF